jgi:hypothetical protein
MTFKENQIYRTPISLEASKNINDENFRTLRHSTVCFDLSLPEMYGKMATVLLLQ